MRKFTLAIMAATIALRQFDLKKVFAYSTISQLGFMFVAVGTLAPVACIFHLVTHAFFKALLFLSSGVVMHAMGGVLDMRQMSGLKRVLPWTHGFMLVGCLALAGVPPFSGFFSKDEILAAALDRSVVLGGVTVEVRAAPARDAVMMGIADYAEIVSRLADELAESLTYLQSCRSCEPVHTQTECGTCEIHGHEGKAPLLVEGIARH